jgi:hypothetical protein
MEAHAFRHSALCLDLTLPFVFSRWTFGLEEHVPISAIGARAHLIGLVLFAFWGL